MNATSVPTDAIAIYNNALELSNRGDYYTALNEYEKAIKIHPTFVEAYNNIGEIYSQMGNKDRAISTYMEALKIDKNHKILLNLGVEHYNAGDLNAALSHFHESLAKDPGFMEGNFYAGMIYYDHKNYGEAEKHLRAVINVDSGNLKANYLLSYIYYEWKQYEKTLRCLDNIKDIAEEQSFINRYYGFCYYFLGRYDDAVKHLSIALELKPNYAIFKDYLKTLTYENKLKEIGDVNKAIKDLEKHMAKSAQSIQDVTKLSMLYIFKGENSKAEALLISAKEKMGLKKMAS
ncbi:MAG: tetratricopeptide repeat protein [bacterium]|nr:tetratricopeptide repeat protein [bacterium]